MKTIVLGLMVVVCLQMTGMADSVSTALDRIITPRAMHSIVVDEEEIAKFSERRMVVIPREGCADVASRNGFSLSASCEQVPLEKLRPILNGTGVCLCADSDAAMSRVLSLCADLKQSGTSDVLAVGLIEKRDSALENVYGYLKLSLTDSVVGANVEIDGSGLLTMSGMQPMKLAEFFSCLEGDDDQTYSRHNITFAFGQVE